MNIFVRVAFNSKKHSFAISNFLAFAEDVDCYDEGDCIDGNRWFSFYNDISIRPIKGDYLQVSDCLRFIIDKVIVHIDDAYDGENFITAECMYDDSYNG